LVAVGENCMLTESDPTGHAEIAALRRIRAALQGDEHAADRRPRRIVAAPTMVCSLEPCPMCTVAMINAGIRVVVVAGEDAASGALLAGRLTSLPPIWGEIAAARGFEVIDASKDLGPDVARLAVRAGELFETSRDEVDEDLARTGVLDDLQVRRAD
jgi:tRNA(Arg) A34 adenosine deaminase TadA